MRPFLVIGLGGSGGKTIRYLKQSLEEWLREIGWREGMPKAWQFLHIDTPQTQDSPVLPGSPDLLPPREYFSLHKDGVPFSSIVDRLERSGTDFDGWWVDPAYMNVPIAHGAGQYRAIGRILGLDQQENTLGSIRGRIAAMRTADSFGQLSQLREVAQRMEGYVGTPDPVVIIVSSLAGGTGAGIFMDVADMLRAEGEQWLDNSFGILYAADVFRTLSAGAQAGVHPNSAAALAELLNGVYATESVGVAGDSRHISRSGPAFPFLVGHANTKGVVFGDQTEIYRVMGRCLGAVMTDAKVQADFVEHTAGNWQNAAGKYADEGGPRHMLMEPPYAGALQGLGYAEVELGVDRFATYSERRMARDAIDTLVDGHRLRTYGQERYEGMPSEAISAKLAEDRLTGFLDHVGINERGPDHNQVVDGIALPGNERNRITGALANQIYSSVTETVGNKARVDDWVDAVVDQAELLAPGENEQYDSRIRERAREWTSQLTGRLTAELGEIIAEYGLQVALDLLRLVSDEMEAVARELEQERVEFENLTTHVRSNVQATFADLSGQIGSEHDSVKFACAQAVETLVFHRMEEKSRFIARALILDLTQGVIAPLIESVRRALGDLQRKLAPDDVESAPVDGWPRHVPERDRAVPDSLIPGKTVALVIQHESFPGLFDKLLESSLGQDFEGMQERWRVVRHHVVTADFLAEAKPAHQELARTVTSLFEVVDKWQPSEAILLGGEPDRPARFHLHTERDEIVLRARAWMHREGSDFHDFLSLGFRSYLQESDERLDAAVASERERAFQKALASAFEAAEPLVHIDPVRLSEIHGRSLSSYVVPGEIPLKNHRLENWVNKFLDDHLKRQPEDTGVQLTQDDRVRRISIYSMLDGALHPAVFKSLNEPIADGYRNAMTSGRLLDFWKWRRSRALAHAIPLPMPLVRALVRGWFVARFLGLLSIQSEEGTARVVLNLPGGKALSSTPLVSVPGNSRPRELGAFLETLALSIPFAADAGKADEMLSIYSKLIEFGRTEGATGADVGDFRELSPILEAWVASGALDGENPNVPSQLAKDDPSQRATAMADLVERLDDEYGPYAEAERQAGRLAADNAWLGAATLIHEELHRMQGALRARATQIAPEF